MFSPSVELTRTGVVVHAGGDPEPYPVTGIGDLLQLWHWRLEGIEPAFTLGDLARLVRGVGNVDVLSCLLNSPLHEHLEYTGAEGPAAHWPLRYLEVCNVAIPTCYRPDPDRPDVPLRLIADDGSVVAREAQPLPGAGPPEVLLAVGDPDALTGNVEVSRMIGPERHGTWSGPYQVMRMLRGRGVASREGDRTGGEPTSDEGGYDLFFAVLPEIAHLPLRYNADLTLDGAAPWEPEVWQVAITVGEFLHAVFWGLGFNGSPEDRLAMRAAVRERYPGFSGHAAHPLLPWNVPQVH
jgi:hypothetical protein